MLKLEENKMKENQKYPKISNAVISKYNKP